MKQIEIKGSSPNEIISAFRKEHKIKDWELQYKIINESSVGLFGIFGRKQATVQFNLLTTEERIKLFVEKLLHKLEIRYEEIRTETDRKTVYVTIHNSSDAGFLIGKNGNMLEQLQYLINRIFENIHGLERIYIDTEDYRLRQEQTFLRSYLGDIKKVKTTGKSVTLEPMQSSERRIIHKYVESEPSLKTMTIGEGDSKRIVIMPANPPEKPAPKQRSEKTPQQRANTSYQRHNKANPNSRTARKPRPTPREKTPAK
ncbi:MAG: KH domain-containing protein [Candidatus Cloacimonetes bacterium]|nr:KH domain-containing protein [Candidatus Cloacimonadota bacterium]